MSANINYVMNFSLLQQTLLFKHFYLKYTKAYFTGGSEDR